MCGCDIGYTCPRCSAVEDWQRDAENEREQEVRWDAVSAPVAGEESDRV